MTDADNDRIVKTIDLNVPLARVWKALTDHKEFGQWFRVALDQPFEVGAKSTGQMTYPGHEGVPWLVYVERMDAEDYFSFRWHDTESPLTKQGEKESGLLVEFRLEEMPNGTRLTITESGFSALLNPRRIELMRGNEDGWNIQANNLAQYLSA